MKTFSRIAHLLFVCALAALHLALGSTPAGAQQPDTLKHFIPAPPVGVQTGAQVGYSVAVDGDYTVVGVPYDDLGGSNSGVVKVFDSTTGALLYVLMNPTPTAEDNFGYSVAISGTRVVVGAHYNSAGQVVLQVTFTDRTTAIVSIQLP